MSKDKKLLASINGLQYTSEEVYNSCAITIRGGEKMSGKCPVCGAPMENEKCGYCGHVENVSAQGNANIGGVSNQMMQTQIVQPQVIVYNQQNDIKKDVSRKSKSLALILCIFFGWLGLHKFYVGKVGMGLLYMFTVGIGGIGWFIDIILILSGSFRDEFDLPLKQ